jgi:phosphoribosylanthranilate isomerase
LLALKRTRVKICGLTRDQDVDAVVAAGADAIGLNFYRPSSRFIEIETAERLCRRIPPFVTIVALFVNPERAEVERVLQRLPVQLLQFHGDEDEAFCASFGRPYLKAIRMRPGVDLLELRASFSSAQALLLDAFVEGYGGGGKTFDWSMVPAEIAGTVVLSGGLTTENVETAIRSLRPWAVDVSSGVEAARGIKDPERIEAFMAGVRNADV